MAGDSELRGVTWRTWDPDLWRTAAARGRGDDKYVGMGSVHAGRTNCTLDPATAMRRNNCYGGEGKNYCLGCPTGNRKQKGSPWAAGRKNIPPSSSHIASLSVAPYWWSLTWSQLAKPKYWHSPCPSQHHEAKYRRMGLKPKDSNLIAAQ